MAKSFQRFPIVGGDRNNWGTIQNSLKEISLGLISSKLYNNSGHLYISAGKIGIDDGTYKGVISISDAEEISLSGLATFNWFLIVASLSGGSVSISATEIIGANDSNELPDVLDLFYNPLKGGYYTSSKRIIGVVYRKALNELTKVVNCNSFESYSGFGSIVLNGARDSRLIAKFSRSSSYLIDSNTETYEEVTLDTTDYTYIPDCELTAGGRVHLPQGLYLIEAWYTARTGIVFDNTLYSRLRDLATPSLISTFPVIRLYKESGSEYFQTCYNRVSKVLHHIQISANELGLEVSVPIGQAYTILNYSIYIEKIDGE